MTFDNRSTGESFCLWQFGDGDTSTARSPVHVYGANGVYPVQLICFGANGCPDTFRLSLTIARVGTQDLPEGMHIDVSPNPFDAALRIKVILPPNLSPILSDFITVYDVLGKPIKRMKLESSTVLMETADWSEGVYWLTVLLDNRRYWVHKVVKMKQP